MDTKDKHILGQKTKKKSYSIQVRGKQRPFGNPEGRSTITTSPLSVGHQKPLGKAPQGYSQKPGPRGTLPGRMWGSLADLEGYLKVTVPEESWYCLKISLLS